MVAEVRMEAVLGGMVQCLPGIGWYASGYDDARSRARALRDADRLARKRRWHSVFGWLSRNKVPRRAAGKILLDDRRRQLERKNNSAATTWDRCETGGKTSVSHDPKTTTGCGSDRGEVCGIHKPLQRNKENAS